MATLLLAPHVAGQLGGVWPEGPKVYYFPMAKAQLQKGFRTNSIMLESLDGLLTGKDILQHIDSVIITSAASPIGSRKQNDELSGLRANTLKNYILWEYPAINPDKIHTCPAGIDWEGFWAIAEQSPDLPSRSKILALKGSGNEEEVLGRLRTVGGDRTYQYLLREIYPRLQYASVRVVLDDGRSIPPVGSPIKQIVMHTRDTVWAERVVRDTVWTERVVRDTVPAGIPMRAAPSERLRKPFYLAVKNNFIYDLALLPNLAVEVAFGAGYRWSAELQGNWSWWDTGAPDYNYHRVQAAGLEMRRWFMNRTGDPLNGFFAGVYGYGGTYDLRLFAKEDADTGQQSDLSWSAGLSVGYAMPLGRRFNLEFGLGLGYLGGKYHKYNRCDCEEIFTRLSTHRRKYFGPTKAGVSIVWLIGSGVNETYNRKRKAGNGN